MKKIAVAATVAAAALGIGYGATQLATADDPTPGASPTVKVSTPGGTVSGPGQSGGKGQGLKLGHLKGVKGMEGFKGIEGFKGVGHLVSGDLATKLGVDETDLRDAAKKVMQEQFPDADDREAFKGMTPDQRAAELEKRQAAFTKALAKELGIDEAKLTKALDELKTDDATQAADRLKTRLDEAVKDGTLTQAEADAVTKAVEKGVIGPR